MITPRPRKSRDGTVSWQIMFRHDGKQTSRTFPTETGARQFARLIDDVGKTEALTILDARDASGPGAPTLGSWAREHIDSLTGVTDGTRDRYRRILDTRLVALAPLPLDAVTPERIGKWVNQLEQEGLSGKTISNLHGFLSSTFKGALRRGLIAANPCDGTRIPKTEKDEIVTLTDIEFAIFLEQVRPDARDMVTCLPFTGLRFSELTALQVRDVDFNAGMLSVSRAWKYTENNALVLGPPKSRRSRRTIPVPRVALEALARAAAGKASTDFLFTNRAGKPWTRSRFHEGVWQPAAKKVVPLIGKKPTPHGMRHTCASWMLKGGAPMVVVQRHVGHESITVTEAVYSHLEPSLIATAVTALDRAGATAFPQIEG